MMYSRFSFSTTARSNSGQMWEQSLPSGNIVYSVSGNEVESLEQVRSVISGITLDAIIRHVERRGELLYIPVETN